MKNIILMLLGIVIIILIPFKLLGELLQLIYNYLVYCWLKLKGRNVVWTYKRTQTEVKN